MNKCKNHLAGWLFTGPYLLFSLLFFLIPLAWSIFLSITNWDLMSADITIVGIKNFIKAMQSPGVKAAFQISYKFLIIYIPISFVLSLSIALMVNSLPRFRQLYMVGFFLPYLSSGVVTSLIVNGLLSYNSPLNQFTRNRLGINIDWLGTPVTALLIVAVMVAWKMSGYYALILSSGLNNINQEIYEAAAVDGVNARQKLFKITLPLLYPSIFTVLTMSFGLCFGIFTEVYQLTGGGPGYATNTWQMEIYNQAFVNLKTGYASAVALMAAVVTFVSVWVLKKLVGKWGESNGWS